MNPKRGEVLLNPSNQDLVTLSSSFSGNCSKLNSVKFSTYG